MSRAKYKERLDFLMKFLDLPSKTRLVNLTVVSLDKSKSTTAFYVRPRALINMSGGQQRRASLAVALLHEPELLILDEPTVGVDPLLRTSIWDHLLELSSPNNNGSNGGNAVVNGSAAASKVKCTIVITTHYIEEARQAHRVGMMRFGKMLAEDTPQNLLER